MRKKRSSQLLSSLSELSDFPATRGQYIRMTEGLREITYRLPGRAQALNVPTYLCAALYAVGLLALLLRHDARAVRAILVPAACFLVVTVLRPIIGRTRPYDRFDAPPVGRYTRGKGRSMPSRHAASAAAIACAVVYAIPGLPMGILMLAMTLLIASLRVLSGQHYVSDVLAAVALSVLMSLFGYAMV